MARRRAAVLATLLLLGTGLTSRSEAITPISQPTATPAEATAARLLHLLQAGDTDAVNAMLSSDMAAAVPATRLQALWNSLGALQEQRQRTVQVANGATVLIYALRFQSRAVDAHIAVDASNAVIGFLLRPADVAGPLPAVPADAPYTERDLDIATTRGPLPATLSLPKGTGPFPAVVLVHGSGPHDRNETIGPNRPFLDVARGLAAHGIAVLRYEKRTRVRPRDFEGNDYTVDDETTDDAVAAIATLSTQAGIDGNRVFVVGHSQGGMLAPRIAARSGRTAGIVLWSAPARSLLTLLPEQNRYVFGLDGSISDAEQAFLDQLDTQIAAARRGDDVPATQLPLGLPRSYWTAFEAIDPVADARALSQPMLLLHGGRDFQVIDTDWRLWQQAGLGARATFLQYPDNNHLGIPGQGPGSMEEYQQPGHVAPRMIEDIAGWVRRHPQASAR